MRSVRDGFTLVELLIAVTLLVMLVLVVGYIFDTTTKTISQVEANNELNVSVEAFSQLIRKDLRGIEHDGFLLFGARQNPPPWMQSQLHAYGSLKDRSNEVQRVFRNDWMHFYTACEQENSSDARTIGLWGDTFYGHGRVSDYEGWGFPGNTYTTGQNASNYSNIGTDWVVMRMQFMILAGRISSTMSVEGVLDSDNALMGYQALLWNRVMSHAQRQCNWYWINNEQFLGSGSVPSRGAFNMPWCAYSYHPWSEPTPVGIYEPTYYNTVDFGNGSYIAANYADNRKYYTLAHCAEFKVQYAMAEDLRNGPNGGINWQDGPMYGRDINGNLSNNYSANASVLGNGTETCRKVFRPGDRWPALLKISTWIFDPLDRFDGGRKLEIVVAVP